LPWSIQSRWLIIVKVSNTFFGANTTQNELWVFPGYSNVTIPPGDSQLRVINFSTSFYGLIALRSVIAKSVTLVEDYSGPLYYNLHREYTNPDGFNLTSVNNRVLDPLDFDKNVVTAFLFRYLTSNADIQANSYRGCIT